MIVLFVELVGFPNTDFLNDVQFDVAFPKIFRGCSAVLELDFRRSGVHHDARFSRRLSKITEDIHLGGGCVYAQLDLQELNTYRHRLSLE